MRDVMVDAPPLVSAIIIFLNAERFLDEAIQSVFAQTHDHWELVLVDDGSTDDSSRIALGYAEAWPARVRYVEHEHHRNRGMSASRNAGIRHARGEYVAFLDADDVWFPEKLARQVAALQANPRAAMVYGPVQLWYSWTNRLEDQGSDLITPPGVDTGVLLEPPTLLVRCIESRQPVPLPTLVMVRRHVAQAVGGFEESFHGPNEVHEDLAFASKVLATEAVVVTAECLGRHRQHPDNSGAFWARRGMYHHERPHPPQAYYLRWLGRYLEQHGIIHPAVSASMRRALWPYRHPLWHGLANQIRYLGAELTWRARAGLIGLAQGARRVRRRNTGRLTADPNPLVARDWSGIGVTTLSWESTKATAVELRVGAPAGALLSRSGSAGRVTTGNWVRDRMEFYLHDMSGGRSPTWATVLAAVRVRVRSREDNDARADQAPTSEPSSQNLLAAEGDLESCARGMAFLDGHGDIEDWGCGAGDARRFVTKSRYIGVDSHDGADRIADLRHYMSITDCVFMRHVLEHRHDWRHVLANAVRSFSARMVLIISTPFGEKTRRIDESPRAGAARVPALSFWKEEVTELLAGHPYREEVITADTPFGIEHIFYIEARSRARA